ncbi:hypothetical protein EDC04DRAFT_2911873 [Pisolithus marmoratus]|nr:hypothetical protein EDC04DRAFT_2911873 [Pisolithus marmoratus]
MDYLPELTHNGQNWITYASSVLCAISDEGLMGFLVRSEKRPIHPAQLEGRGEGWTPQTDDERDKVAVWRTADQLWTQQNATVNYTIICGIPDTIFGLMLHLKSPHEKWDYLEKRFGQIPRPASWLVVEETMWGGNLLPKQDIAEETAQPTGDSDDEPANLPGGEEDSLDIPNDCTETKSGYLMLETEVVDVRQVVDVLPMFEGGTAGLTQHDKHVKELEAPDERSQRASDDIAEGRDLPEWGSEAPEPADDPTSQGSERSIKDMAQTHLEQDQSLPTSGETILDVPGPPPGARIKCPILQDTLSARTHSATTMELKLPCTRRYSEARQGGQLSAQSHSPALLPDLLYWKAWPPDHDTKREKKLLADSKCQHARWEAKRLNSSPAPPEPPPTGYPAPSSTLQSPLSMWKTQIEC